MKTSVRAEQAQAPALASARKASWPEGATAGILLVAAACLAVSLTLYDVAHARQALSELEMLVVQDIFLTETAYLADVILPASAFPEKTGTFTNTDRSVQLGRQALQPPGEARQDLRIINDMARQLGLDWRYSHPRDVFAETADQDVGMQAIPSPSGSSSFR